MEELSKLNEAPKEHILMQEVLKKLHGIGEESPYGAEPYEVRIVGDKICCYSLSSNGVDYSDLEFEVIFK